MSEPEGPFPIHRDQRGITRVNTNVDDSTGNKDPEVAGPNRLSRLSAHDASRGRHVELQVHLTGKLVRSSDVRDGDDGRLTRISAAPATLSLQFLAYARIIRSRSASEPPDASRRVVQDVATSRAYSSEVRRVRRANSPPRRSCQRLIRSNACSQPSQAKRGSSALALTHAHSPSRSPQVRLLRRELLDRIRESCGCQNPIPPLQKCDWC